ncbi:hypothetical protein RRG08_019004 [Elysia crispata]|uniref:Uncharacterized protein n=1 Tax=Elysia crispata TaxID=231223 RepID=A0AAE1DTT1_9GAST|nr:hypothetical protein RRG08_019004 [Elysia crispata]
MPPRGLWTNSWQLNEFYVRFLFGNETPVQARRRQSTADDMTMYNKSAVLFILSLPCSVNLASSSPLKVKSDCGKRLASSSKLRNRYDHYSINTGFITVLFSGPGLASPEIGTWRIQTTGKVMRRKEKDSERDRLRDRDQARDSRSQSAAIMRSLGPAQTARPGSEEIRRGGRVKINDLFGFTQHGREGDKRGGDRCLATGIDPATSDVALRAASSEMDLRVICEMFIASSERSRRKVFFNRKKLKERGISEQRTVTTERRDLAVQGPGIRLLPSAGRPSGLDLIRVIDERVLGVSLARDVGQGRPL